MKAIWCPMPRKTQAASDTPWHTRKRVEDNKCIVHNNTDTYAQSKHFRVSNSLVTFVSWALIPESEVMFPQGWEKGVRLLENVDCNSSNTHILLYHYTPIKQKSMLFILLVVWGMFLCFTQKHYKYTITENSECGSEAQKHDALATLFF
jgi:hypothetical protein